MPLLVTITAESLPLTVRIGLAPTGPPVTDNKRVSCSVSPPSRLGRRSSPLSEPKVRLAGKASAGMVASAVVPVAGTSVMDADTAPLTVTVPLPLALSLFDAR